MAELLAGTRDLVQRDMEELFPQVDPVYSAAFEVIVERGFERRGIVRKNESMDVEFKRHGGVKLPFDDPQWLFEIKHDGFPALALIENDRCELMSRNGHRF